MFNYHHDLPAAPNLVDAVNFPVFTDQHPLLLPERHTPMRYQAHQDMVSKLETGPPFVKLEKLVKGEDFHHNNLHTSPTYMSSADSSHPAPETTHPNPIPSYPQHNMGRYQTQYAASHGFTSSGTVPQQSFEYFACPSQGNELGIMTPNQKPVATRRGPFKDPQARIRTAQTRKMGSCVRCRMQRIRVRPNSMLKGHS